MDCTLGANTSIIPLAQANPGAAGARGAPRTKIRWHHLIVLACLVCMGTFIRLDGITQTGLWGDEFQALFLATGGGAMR
jgi:hypothetical protein